MSVALVADDGREFYGARSDFDRANCSEFVRAAMLSQLGQYPGRVFTREALRTALVAWLDQFAGEPERVLCFDYGGDWELLCDLLDGSPAGWQAHHVGQLLDPGRQEDYYHEHHGRHHALVDARAKRTHQVPRPHRKPPGTSCEGAMLNNTSIPLGVAFRKNPPPP